MRPAAFAAAVLALALAESDPAAAETNEIVELESASVRLLEPADGTELTGGQWAEIAWENSGRSRGLHELEAAEEWELFLSVDGGSTFSVRLTPHLDLDLRHVSFEVPNLPSDDVRLLFRYGDERRERAFRLPGRFRIRAGSPAAALAGSAVTRLAVEGEPALSGALGVAHWSDGARDGGGRVERSAGLRGAALAGAPIVEAFDAEALRAEERVPETLAAPRTAPISAVEPRRTASRPRRTPAAAHDTDLLLLLGRRNE